VVNGQNLLHLTRRRLPYYRRGIGIIFQDHKLLADRSVADNVALPLVVAGYRGVEIARRVRAALDKVGLLGKERSTPQTLSGGEQQRVGMPARWWRAAAAAGRRADRQLGSRVVA